MWAAFVALGLAAAIKNPSDHSRWILLLIFFGIGSGLLLWLKAYRLEFAENVLTYKSLFGGSNSIALANIQCAYSPTGVKKFTEPFLPTNRIEITMKAGIKPGRVTINTKVFSRDAVARLMQCLSPWW